MSLEKFTEKHIDYTNKLSSILKNEKNVDMNILENSKGVFNDIDELKMFLIESEIEQVEEIANLLLQIHNNTDTFLKNLTFSKSLTENEAIQIITNEIIWQLNLKLDRSSLMKASDCQRAYDIAMYRCERNFAIGVAGLAVSAFFTFGLGSVVGATVIAGIAANCGAEALSDYNDCREAL
ncbi:hypothetical protein [Ichthyenterobacterium magnum]|uniref:Uncharacterized protein n=1 Tax=Ichthyenterobacterium magnum TaxID=1230530 RepID=A0A420DUW1_9FLAO|nr:hypothetical protein [Ichthyenterobacterium magnum]RKE97948.1 hypothetical protein BXY80_0013 [Ichthyenterobacterium magnum]